MPKAIRAEMKLFNVMPIITEETRSGGITIIRGRVNFAKNS